MHAGKAKPNGRGRHLGTLTKPETAKEKKKKAKELKVQWTPGRKLSLGCSETVKSCTREWSGEEKAFKKNNTFNDYGRKTTPMGTSRS